MRQHTTREIGGIGWRGAGARDSPIDGPGAAGIALADDVVTERHRADIAFPQERVAGMDGDQRLGVVVDNRAGDGV